MAIELLTLAAQDNLLVTNLDQREVYDLIQLCNCFC